MIAMNVENPKFCFMSHDYELENLELKYSEVCNHKTPLLLVILATCSLRSSRFRFLQAKRGKRARALGKKEQKSRSGGEERGRKGNACR